MSGGPEYEIEDIPGIPGYLPRDEKLLWQGSPDWMSFLIHALHVRWLLVYFALMMAWRFNSALSHGMSLQDACLSALWIVVLATIVLSILAGFAVATARWTVYTITSRRIVLRYGLAVPMAINIPYAQIESAGIKRFADGTGEIPVTIGGDDRFAYLVLWPHTRRWHFSRPQPMIRSIAEPDKVAGILIRAITAAQEEMGRQLQPSGAAVSPARETFHPPQTKPLNPIITAMPGHGATLTA